MRLLTMVMLCFTSWIIGCGEQANILMNQQTKTAEAETTEEQTTEHTTYDRNHKAYEALRSTGCLVYGQLKKDDPYCVDLVDPRYTREAIMANPLILHQVKTNSNDPGPLPIPSDALTQLGSIYGMDIRIPAMGTDKEAIADFYGRDNYIASKGGNPVHITDIVDYVSDSGWLPPRVAIFAYASPDFRESEDWFDCDIYRFDSKLLLTFFKDIGGQESVVAQGIHPLPTTVDPNGDLGLDWKYYYHGPGVNSRIDRWPCARGQSYVVSYVGSRYIVESDVIGVDTYHPLDDRYPGMMRLQVAVDEEGQVFRGRVAFFQWDPQNPKVISTILMTPGYFTRTDADFRIFTRSRSNIVDTPDVLRRVPMPPHFKYHRLIGLAMHVDFIVR